MGEEKKFETPCLKRPETCRESETVKILPEEKEGRNDG